MPSPIPRTLRGHLASLGAQLAAVIVTGPRQAGKATLCRLAWPSHPYVNLERPDLRAFAQSDAREFLAAYPDGAILDEIQRVPELTSWLQVLIDEDPRPGRWILTGSEQLTLTGRTSQSLAGRAGFAFLLPLDVEELASVGVLAVSERAPTWTAAILRGGYPAPFAMPVSIDTWLSGYVQSYLERDVRGLLGVSDLSRFQDFLALAAGRATQTVNFSQLASDVGVTHPTAKSWLSVLEATFVTGRLRPWHKNLGKRLVKSSKLFFWDVGLLCHLLRIHTAEQLSSHPLRGPIFENWVVAELLKMLHHRGERPDAYFYRDQQGHEVDLLLRRPDHWLAVEVKSSATVAGDFFAGLRRFAERAEGTLDGLPLRLAVVYGGDERERRSDVEVVPWRGISGLLGSLS